MNSKLDKRFQDYKVFYPKEKQQQLKKGQSSTCQSGYYSQNYVYYDYFFSWETCAPKPSSHMCSHLASMHIVVKNLHMYVNKPLCPHEQNMLVGKEVDLL